MAAAKVQITQTFSDGLIWGATETERSSFRSYRSGGSQFITDQDVEIVRIVPPGGWLYVEYKNYPMEVN